MHHYLKSALILFLLTVYFVGCKQGDLEENLNTDQNILKIQSWLSNQEIQFENEILWDEAKRIDINSSLSTIINAPFDNENNNQIFELVTFNISDSEISSALWVMKSDEEAFNESHFSLTTHEILKSFTGTLWIKNPYGKIEEQISYKNGTIEGVNSLAPTRVLDVCGSCHYMLDDVIITPDDDGTGDDSYDPCTFNYDPCSCDGIGCSGGGSGSGSTGDGGEGDSFELDSTVGNLCDNIGFLHSANSFKATVSGLGLSAINNSTSQVLNAELGTVCVDLPEYLISSVAEASIITTNAFNLAREETELGLNSGIIAPNSSAVRSALITEFLSNLQTLAPGASLSTTSGCLGNVPQTIADYGC